MVVRFDFDDVYDDEFEGNWRARQKWKKLVGLLKAYRFFQESFTQMSLATKSIPDVIREDLKVVHGTSRRARSR